MVLKFSNEPWSFDSISHRRRPSSFYPSSCCGCVCWSHRNHSRQRCNTLKDVDQSPSIFQFTFLDDNRSKGSPGSLRLTVFGPKARRSEGRHIWICSAASWRSAKNSVWANSFVRGRLEEIGWDRLGIITAVGASVVLKLAESEEDHLVSWVFYYV